MLDLSHYNIRYSELQDEEYLKKWLSDRKEWKWFPFSNEEEMLKVVKNWVGFSKIKASLTGTFKEKPVAMATLFLMPYKKVSHHCMFYLIVNKKHRKQGIGHSMLKNLLHLAENYFRLEFVHMEVYEGCPVISLLEKFQFKKFAEQEAFVKQDHQYINKLFFQFDFNKDGKNHS